LFHFAFFPMLIFLTLERFIDFRQVAEALAEDPTILFLTRL
jgi:hypothetical protein